MKIPTPQAVYKRLQKSANARKTFRNNKDSGEFKSARADLENNALPAVLMAGAGLVDVLKTYDLGITSAYLNTADCFDVPDYDLYSVLKLCAGVAKKNNIDLYIRTDFDWIKSDRNFYGSQHIFKLISKRTELLVCDKNGIMSERYSVFSWALNNDAEAGAHFESNHPERPVRRSLGFQNGAMGQRMPVDGGFARPIDAVYTWVNGQDEDWLKLLAQYRSIDKIDKDRFVQHDELRYSIRSLKLYAPWIRTIYIFSNCRPPAWFIETGDVKWVRHEDVMEPRHLPTFNSHSIEAYLHKLPGLAEHFIYMNDDFFFANPADPGDFFTPFGQSVSRLEPYGVVNHFVEAYDKGKLFEWQKAAANGARLLFDKNGYLPNQLHTHTPYALQKSLLDAIEAEYPAEIETTRSARFRRSTDLSLVSFFYHHYALAKGRAIHRKEPSLIVRHTNFKLFARARIYQNLRFFCLNDGGGSSTDANYNRFKTEFLSRQFPFKANCEVSNPD